MSNGIVVEYSLCPDYFEVGCAYRLRLGENNYKVGLLVSYSKESVTFKILKDDKLEDLVLTVSNLRFRDYNLIKMKPDYKNGRFSVDD